MKTLFPKKEYHVPKWFLIDGKNQLLGRLATKISNLLIGKNQVFYTPGVDQGNFVIIINAQYLKISGNKDKEKLYYSSSQRPGNLKSKTFNQLQNKIPGKVLEKAIFGMLPKGVLGRQYYKRLYIYKDNPILLNTNKLNINFIKL
jgi:large subunit ribosomal protein L13